METFRLMMQILLLAFCVALAFVCILNRRKYPSRFDYVSNLFAIVTLTLWLFLAGAFDRFLW